MVGRRPVGAQRVEAPELRIHRQARTRIAAEGGTGVVQVVHCGTRVGTIRPDDVVHSLGRGKVPRRSTGKLVLEERDHRHGLSRPATAHHEFDFVERVKQVLPGCRILEVGVLGNGRVVDQLPTAEPSDIADLHQEAAAQLTRNGQGGVDAVRREHARINPLAPCQSLRVGRPGAAWRGRCDPSGRKVRRPFEAGRVQDGEVLGRHLAGQAERIPVDHLDHAHAEDVVEQPGARPNRCLAGTAEQLAEESVANLRRERDTDSRREVLRVGCPQRSPVGVVNPNEPDRPRFVGRPAALGKVQASGDVVVQPGGDTDLHPVDLPHGRHERPAQSRRDGQPRPGAPSVLEVELQLFHAECPADRVTCGEGVALDVVVVVRVVVVDQTQDRRHGLAVGAGIGGRDSERIAEQRGGIRQCPGGLLREMKAVCRVHPAVPDGSKHAAELPGVLAPHNRDVIRHGMHRQVVRLRCRRASGIIDDAVAQAHPGTGLDSGQIHLLPRETVPEIADRAATEQARVSNCQSSTSVIGFPVRILAGKLRHAANMVVLVVPAHEHAVGTVLVRVPVHL